MATLDVLVHFVQDHDTLGRRLVHRKERLEEELSLARGVHQLVGQSEPIERIRAIIQTAASSEWIEPLGPLRRAMSLALRLDSARAQRAAGTSQLFTRTTVRIHGWMQHS